MWCSPMYCTLEVTIHPKNKDVKHCFEISRKDENMHDFLMSKGICSSYSANLKYYDEVRMIDCPKTLRQVVAVLPFESELTLAFIGPSDGR